MSQESFLKARAFAYRLLAGRSRTIKEVQDRLLAKKVSPEILSQVIRELKESNYLNDEEYARTWAQSRLNSKAYGPRRVEQELFHKGITDEIVAKVIAEVYAGVNLLELAKKTLGKKGEEPSRDIKTRQRLYRYLWRRGFPEEVIQEVLNV